MTSQPLLTHFFGSSEILKLFKAKPQSKTIQWFNFSYMGKTNSKPGTKTITLIRFHLLVLALNYRNVFSRSDDVTIPHLLLCDVKMLSILIENIVLEESQENISITSVFIHLL